MLFFKTCFDIKQKSFINFIMNLNIKQMRNFTLQKSILLLLVAFLFTPLLRAQNPYTGDLTLSNQAEVDAFNYTEVTGELTIRK